MFSILVCLKWYLVLQINLMQINHKHVLGMHILRDKIYILFNWLIILD